MIGTRRTGATKGQPPKVEETGSQSKATTKGKGKQKQGEDKAAKANLQVEDEEEAASLAKLANGAINEVDFAKLLNNYSVNIINDKPADPEQAPKDESKKM